MNAAGEFKVGAKVTVITTHDDPVHLETRPRTVITEIVRLPYSPVSTWWRIPTPLRR